MNLELFFNLMNMLFAFGANNWLSVAISIIIWQLIVQTKANSVNNSNNIHISSNTQVIEIHHHAEQPKPSASEGVEEVPFEEVTDEDKNTKKPLK